MQGSGGVESANISNRLKMKVGDLVRVETKFHGKKFGTIVDKVKDSFGVSWEVHIPNHWTVTTIAASEDIEVIK